MDVTMKRQSQVDDAVRVEEDLARVAHPENRRIVERLAASEAVVSQRGMRDALVAGDRRRDAHVPMALRASIRR
jgi:hypothetical protein